MCLFFRWKMSQRKEERGAILRRRTKHDDDLPDEIVLDILAKLPVKSLLRFRCVCKPWYSSIANPSFISTHHLNHSYVIHIPRNIPIPFFPGSSHSSDQVCTLASDRTFETISEFRVPFISFGKKILVSYLKFVWNQTNMIENQQKVKLFLII